ncbi:MAG: RNA polymerase sporulation sigma factor SigK [Bacilli bacterium]
MLKKILNFLKTMHIFTTSYSINVFPEPLKLEDEEKYIKLAKNGDKHARNELIEHNLRLVAHIVKKYDNYKESSDDLISIGTIGLIKGIDTYELGKKVKLSSYIAKCAENEILMHIRGNKKNLHNISLNECLGRDKDGNEVSFIDVIEQKNKDIHDTIYLKDNIHMLKDFIDILNDREKKIITYRYGLYNNNEYTQKEIASMFHISRSYVSRIEKRALIKMLREFIKKDI